MSIVILVASTAVLGFSVVYYCTLIAWALLSSRAATKRAAGHSGAPGSGERSLNQVGVSLIVPAYNEGPVVVSAVRNIFHQTHQLLEIIVVNDGSTDDTLEQLIESFDLVAEPLPDRGPIESPEIVASYRSTSDPRLRVVDQANSGFKAGGSNTGINLAQYEWVVIRDGDELMEPDVLARCLAEVERSSSNVVAVGATLLPANECRVVGDLVVANRTSRNPWVGVQTIEYMTAFFLTRPGMAEVGVLPFVSGGYGMFRRQALFDVGGLAPGHMGEDLEVCLQIHEHHIENGIDYEVRHVPEAIVWTEFPSTRAVLRRQRRRWQWGLESSVAGHRRMLTSGRYGRLGRVGYGTMHVFEWWGGFVEAAGWLVLLVLAVGGWLNVAPAIALVVITQSIGIAVLASSIVLAVRRIAWFDDTRDLLWLFLWMLVAGFGFRQLALWWRIGAVAATDRSWGEMNRSGFNTLEPVR